MTSPAQLKYLEAIGIPVWVSRERIVLVDNKKTMQVGLSSESSDCVGSAEDILHDLEHKTGHSIKEGFKLDKVRKTVDQVLSTSSQQQTTTADKLANEVGRTKHHIIYACGKLEADWLIIGESPETSEERQQQPFSADSGLLLSNMLRSVGLINPREDAYLINVLRQPLSTAETDSSAQLNQLLHEKIIEIKPKIILSVGQISAQNLLQSTEPLARLRSKQHTYANTDIPLVVTYYPSYLLSKPLDKRKAWDDLKLAMSLMVME
ncbi:MAG: uracil-DNA glycosylase family protein [Cocleimonas sp.]